tara:strand:- start:477 stop:821 length:345 start_codon:yes stop_codon:yes gene_type:complete
MNKANMMRFLSLSSYFGLIIFGMAWSIFLGNIPDGQISLSLLFFLPLFLPLRGILHRNKRSILWGTLISLLYILHGGQVWWADSINWFWGALETILAVTTMITGSFYIRWQTES